MEPGVEGGGCFLLNPRAILIFFILEQAFYSYIFVIRRELRYFDIYLFIFDSYQ
jgi:hypothetical protein